MRILLLFLVVVSSAFSQGHYPKDSFSSPLDIPILLSGTFGELRSNHFHSGLDIKTQQREGLTVYSIAEGYISRIKVSAWGYGKALYITHPNGYTSVYAHLQKFTPEIETYIKKRQYDKKSFEIEIFPSANELPVVQKQAVAYSGNTGGSGGPHLHFEIRETASEKPINPLHFGLKVPDSEAPTILGLFAYPLSDNAHINNTYSTQQLKITKQKDGSFLADSVYAFGTIGFGINAYDRQDKTYNKNGVYKIEMLVNGTSQLSYRFDSFSFDETRLINTLIDYEYLITHRQRVQQSFKIRGNQLSIYERALNDGKLLIDNNTTYNATLLIKDFNNNETVIRIPIQGRTKPKDSIIKAPNSGELLIATREQNYTVPIGSVHFPANTFYDDFYIDLQSDTTTITIHNNKVPVHNFYNLTFDVTKYSEEDKKQLFIAAVNSRGKLSYENTVKKENLFTTRTRTLGKFTLAKDTIPPKIVPVNFKKEQWLTNFRNLQLKITDDLSGISDYKAFINGEWILMEYEPKNNTLTFDFDDFKSKETKHNFELIVTDAVGNSTTFTSTFYRKN